MNDKRLLSKIAGIDTIFSIGKFLGLASRGHHGKLYKEEIFSRVVSVQFVGHKIASSIILESIFTLFKIYFIAVNKIFVLFR